MRNDIAVLAIVTAMALSFIVGYSFSPGVPVSLQEKPAAPSAPATPKTAAPAAGEGVKEFTIEASDFKFEPSTITVTEGDVVRITIKNVGSKVHNFVIDELGVCAVKPAEASEGYGGGYGEGYGAGYGEGYGGGYGEAAPAGIQPGESVTVEFVAEKAGEYTFYCPMHRDMGMEGKLIVEPKGAAEAQPSTPPPAAEASEGYGGGYGEGYGAGYGEGY